MLVRLKAILFICTTFLKDCKYKKPKYFLVNHGIYFLKRLT
nr:MAG TPA: hypothetical protein [Bacteriophage sp.]